MPNIRRVPKKTGFSVFKNNLLRDRRLSFAARGLLVYLLSHKDDWIVRMDDLVKQSPAGRDAMYGLVSELCKFGYMARIKRKDKKGYFTHEIIVSEEPLSEAEIEEIVSNSPLPENPEVDEPDLDFPEVAYPDLEKPDTKERLREESLREERSKKRNIKSKYSGSRRVPETKRDYDSIVKRLFEFWQNTFRDVLDVNQYSLTDLRKKMIGDRLRSRLAWTEQQCEIGIKGLRLSPWHMGQHPENKKLYLDPKYIFETDDVLEKRIREYREWEKAQPCQFCNDTGVIIRPVLVPDGVTKMPEEVWSQAVAELERGMIAAPAAEEIGPADKFAWDAIRETLRGMLSSESFTRWFEPLAFLSIDHSQKLIHLRAPSSEVSNWIGTNYSSVVGQTLEKSHLAGYQIAWQVAESISLAELKCEGVNCEVVYFSSTVTVKKRLTEKYGDTLSQRLAKHFGREFKIKWLIEEKIICNHS